jgi:hypothetical protein
LFGASAPVAKALLHNSPAQLLAGLLYVGSGVGLGVVTAVRRRYRKLTESRIDRRELPWLAAAIFWGGVVGPVLLMIGLSRTPASNASLLLNLEGVFTALIAWVVFRENVDRRIALGMFRLSSAGLRWRGSGAPSSRDLLEPPLSPERAYAGESTTTSHRRSPAAIRSRSRCSRAHVPDRSMS